MRGAFLYAARKIGAFTTTYFPEITQVFYDHEKRALGVGDGTLNGSTMLTENSAQSMLNKTIDSKRNKVLNLPCVGALIVTAGDVRPDMTYLKCDGSKVLRSQYPELFEVIQTSYGSNEGLGYFSLPSADVMGSIHANCRVWIKALP